MVLLTVRIVLIDKVGLLDVNDSVVLVDVVGVAIVEVVRTVPVVAVVDDDD